MNKETVKKILSNIPITQQEVSEFVVDYCKLSLNEDITSEQLQGILHACQSGFFNLRYAAEQAAIKMDWTVITTTKNGVILKVELLEKQE